MGFDLSAIAAAAAQFAPDRPSQSWRCIVHDRDCPRLDRPASREFYDRVITAIRLVQDWSDDPIGDEGFREWVERESRACRPATEADERQRVGIFADQEAINAQMDELLREMEERPAARARETETQDNEGVTK